MSDEEEKILTEAEWWGIICQANAWPVVDMNFRPVENPEPFMRMAASIKLIDE